MAQIFGDGQEREDFAALWHVAEPEPTIRSGSMPWIGLPSSSIVPFCGSSTPEMVLRMRGLAGAVGAEHCDNLARAALRG